MANLQWDEMTVGQRTALVSAGVLQFGLLGAALVDLMRRTPGQINGSKRFWLPFVFLNFIGPIAYLARGRKPAA